MTKEALKNKFYVEVKDQFGNTNYKVFTKKELEKVKKLNKNLTFTIIYNFI